MVRLLRNVLVQDKTERNRFQSHNGAIAASQNGSITKTNRRVSIPQWCDCCRLPEKFSRASTLVSIPQWCDCCIFTSIQTLTILSSFNPTMVRLLRNGQQLGERMRRSFNPTMVRLLLLEVAPGEFVRATVSIPQWCDCCDGKFLLSAPANFSFNPTMVRLLPGKGGKKDGANMEFQSHNGAIAAQKLQLVLNPCDCFNPTMVRLLPNSSIRTASQVRKFQSHNGAIAAGSISTQSYIGFSFNPTMVRLLHSFTES